MAAGQPLSAPAAGSPRPGPATCCCGSARGSALRAGTPRRLAGARAGVWSRLWRRGRRDPGQRTLYLRTQSTRRAAVSHAGTRNANGAAEPLRPHSAAIGRDVPKGRRGDAACSCRNHAGPETPDTREEDRCDRKRIPTARRLARWTGDGWRRVPSPPRHGRVRGGVGTRAEAPPESKSAVVVPLPP